MSLGIAFSVVFSLIGLAGALGLVLAYFRGNLAKGTIETLEKNTSALQKRVEILEAEKSLLETRVQALEDTNATLKEMVTSRAEVAELTRISQENFKKVLTALSAFEKRLPA